MAVVFRRVLVLLIVFAPTGEGKPSLDDILDRLAYLEKNLVSNNQIKEENIALRERVSRQENVINKMQFRLDNTEERCQKMETRLNNIIEKLSTELSNENKNTNLKLKIPNHAKVGKTVMKNKIIGSVGKEKTESLLQTQDHMTNNTVDVTSLPREKSRIIRDPTNNIRKRYSNSVAFAATLTTTLYNGASGQVVVFDNVYLNEGNDYDWSHGVFVCQIPGLYLLSVTIHLDVQHKFAFNLMVNSIEKARMYAEYANSNSAVTTIVRLNTGDRAYVEVEMNGSFTNGGRYSSFSGVRIAD